MNVILLFLDGVGIGSADATLNPFFAGRLPYLRHLLGSNLPHRRFTSYRSDSVALGPVNATLRVPGLPQSGTGQAAIFTGVNAPLLAGRHFGPYPPSTLRPLIEAKNIFRRLLALRKRVVFANAFPEPFFAYVRSGTRRLTVTTLSCLMAGVPLLTAEDLRKDRALSADFTRSRWPELGHPDVLPTTPRQAGEHLADIGARHDFTLFEYWLPDHAGHRQELPFAVEVLERFDQFLEGLVETADRARTIIISISDHGNIEDLSTRAHTRNPVPCLAIGAGAGQLTSRIRTLAHVTPQIVDLLNR
jgi:hypothetical protein